jgi:hypothetical protein
MQILHSVSFVCAGLGAAYYAMLLSWSAARKQSGTYFSAVGVIGGIVGTATWVLLQRSLHFGLPFEAFLRWFVQGFVWASGFWAVLVLGSYLRVLLRYVPPYDNMDMLLCEAVVDGMQLVIVPLTGVVLGTTLGLFFQTEHWILNGLGAILQRL